MSERQAFLRAHGQEGQIAAVLLLQVAEVFGLEAVVMTEQPFQYSVAKAGEAMKLPVRSVDRKEGEDLGKLGDR